MKKSFRITLLACLAALMPGALLHAQAQDLLAFNHTVPAVRSTAAITETEVPSYKSHVGVYVRAKVMRTFLQWFADATDVRWHLSDNQYFASFKNGGRLCKALFAYNGELLYTIQYIGEKDLPKEVRKQLRSTYTKYAIRGVSEMDANKEKAWIVNLQDADNLIVVRITADALEELHQYKTHL